MRDPVNPDAGDLRHRLDYQTQAQTGRDAYGKPVYAWSTAATYWGSIRQLSGREGANADRLKITASHVVRTRYFGGASALGRWKFGTRIFSIERANNPDERNVAYEFYVTEVVNPPQ